VYKLNSDLNNKVNDLNLSLKKFTTNTTEFINNQITMSQPQIFYNAIMLMIRGNVVISPGAYTCNVTDGTYWFPALVYLGITDAEKIFPGCSSLSNGTAIMGWFSMATNGNQYMSALVKHSVSTVQLVTSAVRGNSNGERVTITNSIVLPPVTLIKSAQYIDL